MGKPRFGVDLHLNDLLFICQVFYKLKYLLVVFLSVF